MGFLSKGAEEVKALVVTNLYPHKYDRSRGIFITKRLQQYGRLGIEYIAIPLAFQGNVAIRSLKRILRRPEFTPIEQLEGVFYRPVFVKADTIWGGGEAQKGKPYRKALLTRNLWKGVVIGITVNKSLCWNSFLLDHFAFTYQTEYCSLQNNGFPKLKRRR